MPKFIYTYNRVRFLCSIPDSCHKLEMWNTVTAPLLFVTGLSGSGKTTICGKLSKQYGCAYISLDALRFYNTASLESRRAVDEFLLIYPHIAPSIDNHWARQGVFDDSEREYAKYTRLFVQFLKDRAIYEQQKYIVEGIQLFVRLPKEALLNQPKIILGTGGLKCFYRATKRTYSSIYPRLIPSLIQRFMRYCVVQRVRLNYYKVYWKKHESVFPVTKTCSQ